MIIDGIDPGPETSGLVRAELAPEEWPPRIVEARSDIGPVSLLTRLRLDPPDVVVCEWITSYGMAVGASVFDTCRFVGRIEQHCEAIGVTFELLARRDVKLEVCGTSRAKDTNVRQALIDIYPRTGGGKKPQIGTKGAPGPLYGMKSHTWPALAVVVAWLRLHHMDRPRP